ncbi:MAG: DUF502 domain-containing protein [Verrucomicrobiia bacterium]|jgi:uncharacterized membrane protein
MVDRKKILHWFKTNFFTGLAIVLPAVISIGILLWLFGTIAGLTDVLLFFLPKEWTHQNNGTGPVYWYWSLLSLIVSVLIVCAIGNLARYYIGRKFILFVENTMLKIPLLNKIYSTVKQINEAFTSSKKSSFKQVVLVEFPKPGIYSIGFLTAENHEKFSELTQKKLVSVFVPTTPNPTTGFIALVPENEIIKLDMSVPEGIKFIISLGSISPEYNEEIKPDILVNKLQKPE